MVIANWILDQFSRLAFCEALFSSFLLPIALGVLGFIASHTFHEWKQRKRQSLIGSAVVESLIEEVSKGIEIMENVKSALYGASPNGNFGYGPLPSKSWSGMQTVSDDVLERILLTANGRPVEGFPARQVRTHLKNYFEYMCDNWECLTKIDPRDASWAAHARKLIHPDSKGDHLEAARGVLTMLKQIKRLLDANSKAWLPK